MESGTGKLFPWNRSWKISLRRDYGQVQDAKTHKTVIGVAFLVILGVAAFHDRPLVAADRNYHLLKEVVLGGEGFWDYLNCDSAARRVYISRGSHVMTMNADSCAVVGDIPGTEGVHGTALAPVLGRGYMSDGRANAVTIFNLDTLKVLGREPTGEGPDAIIYDPASKRVFIRYASFCSSIRKSSPSLPAGLWRPVVTLQG